MTVIVQAPADNTVPLGRFTLDAVRNVLRAEQGEVIALSPIAVQVLQLLARRPGEVVERTELVDALWRGDWLVGDPALSRVVSEIRSAVGDDPKQPTLIQTVPRRGYRLVPATTVDQVERAPSRIFPVSAGSRLARLWQQANLTIGIILFASIILGVLAIAARNLR